MSAAATSETRGFETEAKQLLRLMIHSLYSNREIFLRELVSNASDAADKLRFAALGNDSLYEGEPELRVRVDWDPEARTLMVADTGIGMSRDEVIAHLGTIAKSGTADFLQNLTGDQRKDAQLIGQFGVGFYSAFIVADRVEVFTRKAGAPPEEGVHWESTGESDYQVATTTRPERGTTVVLHLKEDAGEFCERFRLRNIIKTYSDHISIPVYLRKDRDEDGDAGAQEDAWEQVNDGRALWTLPRTEVSEEEYKTFYKHIAHDFEDPLSWSHNKVEGKLEYTSLLYLPARAPFDLWNRDKPRGLKLYVQRVFIMDDAEQFLPLYLRFIKGVVDSNDLSLNVSREILQRDPKIDSMRSALTKRALDMLNKLAADQPEEYQKFWDEFGLVLKEGPAEDFSNQEKILNLFRFASTHSGPEQTVSLKEYLERMKEGQDKIYFLVADSYSSATTSPHLEVFRDKGVEVLLLSDRIDDWLMAQLSEFQDVSFQDVARGDLDLGSLEDEAEKEEQKAAAEEMAPLVERLKTALGAEVQEVRVTHRLKESPACLVVGEHDLGPQMRKIMEAAGQKVPDSKPIFEVNPGHRLIQRLSAESNEDRFAELAHILFDQAALAEGEMPKDAGAYVARMNRLLGELMS